MPGIKETMLYLTGNFCKQKLYAMTDEEKEKFKDFEEAKILSNQSQQDIRRFVDSMSKHALKLVSEMYADDLLTMESKGFKEINDAVSYSLNNLAVAIDDAVFNNQFKIT